MTVRLTERSWTSHNLMREALGIVLREAAGFEVEYLPYVSSQEANAALALGPLDLDAEAWGYQPGNPDYRDFVESAGETGYKGRTGLYLFRRMLQGGKLYADWYKFFKPSNAQATAGLVTLGEMNMTGMDNCPYSYCRNSTYVAPACEADPASCPVVLAASALWDAGQWESRLRTHDLRLAIAFLGFGFDLEQEVLRRFYTGRDVLFYNFEPNAIVAMSDMVTRLNFPPHVETCPWFDSPTDVSKEPGLHTLPCDWPEFKLYKVAKLDLRRRAPEAFRVVRHLSVPREEMDEMLRNRTLQSRSTWNVSCEWLLAKPTEWWDKIVPACVRNPKAQPQRGDMFFNTDSLECEVKLGQADCASGMVYVQALNACLCAAGHFRSGTTGCEPCSLGTVAEASGQTECTACPVGSFAGTRRASGCVKCAVGRFSAVVGSSACESCGTGKLWTTMQQLPQSGRWVVQEGAQSAAACSCSPGFRQQGMDCVPCGEGMLCPGIGSVRISPGYSSAAALSVFSCFGDTAACPGGLPGQACAEHRYGALCTECPTGMLPAEGGCKECNGGSRTVPVVLAGLIVVSLGSAYWALVRRPGLVESHGLLVVAIGLGQLVVFVQQSAVLGAMAVAWREPMASVFAALHALSVDISLLQIDCLGKLTALSQFLTKLVLIIGAPAALVAVHAALACASRRVPFRWPAVGNASGTVVMVLFISIVSAFVGPLQCAEHPNRRWTCRSFPSVLCWEQGDHSTMVGVSVAALLVPLGFLAIAVRAVLKAPAMVRACDTGFLKAYNFLFFRVRPECYWYALVPLVRGQVMALAPIMPSPVLQIVALQLLLLLCLAIVLQCSPMRLHTANWLDAVLTAFMLLLTSWSAFCVREDASETVAWLVLLQGLFALIVLAAAVGSALLMRLRRLRRPFKYFLCHHKAGAGATARLLKLTLMKTAHGEIFLDSDNLSDLDTLFDVVANFVDTLVVLGSKNIFLRPWCVGEMTTARLSNVRTVLLALPDFRPLEEDFIGSYEDVASGLDCLAKHGMGVGVICETLRWMSDVPCMDVGTVSPQAFQALQQEITRAGAETLKAWQHTQALSCMVSMVSMASKGTSSRGGGGGLVILAEGDDYEAGATAYVLQRLMVPSADSMFQVLLSTVAHDVDCTFMTRVVVLATASCLHSPSFLGALVLAWRQGAQVLPVVVDPSFRFPQKHAIPASLSAAVAAIVGPSKEGPPGQDLSPDFLEKLIESLFQEIAPAFNAHEAMVLLEAQAKEVARRIKNAHALSAAAGAAAAEAPIRKSGAESDGSVAPEVVGQCGGTAESTTAGGGHDQALELGSSGEYHVVSTI